MTVRRASGNGVSHDCERLSSGGLGTDCEFTPKSVREPVGGWKWFEAVGGDVDGCGCNF
jgi:hypothetical protein